MQMSFFAVEQDMRELLKLCEAQVMAIAPVSYKIDEVDPKLQSPMHFKPEESAFLLLPREYSMDDIIYHEGSKGQKGIAHVDMDESPVIRVTPPVLWGTKLDAGGIDMNHESGNPKFSLTERRYSVLMHELKRWAKTEKNQGWVGPFTVKMVKEHRIQLGLGKKPIPLW